MLRTTWEGSAPTSDGVGTTLGTNMKNRADSRRRLGAWGRLGFALSGLLVATSCVTVRPEQRAILADPTMQYESNRLEEAARQHVIENREASYGGGSIQGGGCGCN